MKINIVMILDHHQIFLLNTEGRTTEKFHQHTGGAQIWNNLPNTLKISKTYRLCTKSNYFT